MKKIDLLKLYTAITILFPTTKFMENEFELRLQDEIYFDYLKNYEINFILNYLKEFAKENEFFKIGTFAKFCEKAKQSNELTINDIIREIDSSVSYTNCIQNFNKLSPIAKKVVGFPQQLARWSLAGWESFEGYIKNQIEKAIKIELEREKFKNINNNIDFLTFKSIELKGEKHDNK